MPCKGPCLPPFPSAGRTQSPAPPISWWPCTFCNFGLDQPLLSTTCPSLRLVKCPRRNFILETLRSWSLSRALGDDHSLWIRLPAPVRSSQHPEQAMTGGRELGTGHFENDHHFFVGLVEMNEVIDLCCVSDKVVLRTILRCVGF